jgi:hypothetical protein
MKIAFLTMQKDEKSLLALFIKYHSRFSGFSSVFILDNGSRDDETLKVLKDAEQWGATIIAKYASSDDFEKKGTRIVEIINKLRIVEEYDFIFPMDCDELLCLESNGAINLDPFEIKKHLGTLTDNGEGFRIRKGFNNITLSCEDFHVYDDNKMFFSKTSSIQKLDSGFHGRGLNHLSQCELGYLHLHNKPYHEVLRSSREKLKARINTFTPEDLDGLKQRRGGGKGVHLVKYFQMSMHEYYNQKSARKTITAPLSELAQKIGAEAFINEFTDASHKPIADIFWLKCPTNHHIVDEHIWQELGTSKSTKVIFLAFSDSIQGCPNGNQIFNSTRGFGWITENTVSNEINDSCSPVALDPMLSIADSSLFGIELPAGNYRITAVVNNTYYENYSALNFISDQANTNEPSGVDPRNRLECWTKHLGGVLQAAIKSSDEEPAINLISFEYLP